jgi:hypothetical protein
MTYIVRTFKHIPTGHVYEVAASECYLPPLRRRIVKQCGGDQEWENRFSTRGPSMSPRERLPTSGLD